MFQSADEAEDAFYEAFAAQDIKAMMQVWAEDDKIFCAHPKAVPLSGRGSVETSWMQIFMGTQYRIERQYHHREIADDQLAVHHLTEIMFDGDRFLGWVLATNMYCCTDDGWRMVMHHASQFDLPVSQEQEESSLH